MDSEESLVDTHVRPHVTGGKSYRCYICLKFNRKGNLTPTLLGKLSQAQNHLQSYSHQNTLKKLKKEDIKNSATFINVRYCTQCQVYLKNDEILRCHCLLHFYEAYKECLIDTDIVKFNFCKDGKLLINCLLCKKELNDEKMLALHLQSHSHTKRLNLLSRFDVSKIPEHSVSYELNSSLTDISEYNNKSNIIVIPFCSLCDENILESNATEHVKKNHNQDKFNLEFKDNDEIEINPPDLYTCFICDRAYSNQISLLKHFNSKEHNYINTSFHQILKNSHFTITTMCNKGLFFCKICCMYTGRITTALNHIQSLKHSLKEKNGEAHASTSVPIPVYKSQCDIPNLAIENKATDVEDNVLNELVPLDLPVKETKRASIKKSRRNGKGNNPHSQRNLRKHFDKNLCSFADDYIKMCIEPGEKNIYNIELELQTIINISNLVKNLWYYAQVFLCNICFKRIEFELDFIIHLVSKTHIKKLNELKLKDKETRFYICPICVTYWYGEADTFEEHCEGFMHKRFLNNNEFAVPDLSTTAINLLTEVDKNVNHLLNESNKTYNDEQEREHKLLKSIETVAQVAYPQAKAYIFGSRLSYLGFPDSDVDIFLDCENVYHNKFCSSRQSAEYLQTVRNLLASQQDSWIIEEVLFRTRVPILKLRHIDTNLKCDISFLNGLGVEKSKLIGYFNKAYPMCRQLILYLKKWLKNCRLLGASGITTYAASWFVIFYLQTENILPSVHSLLGTKQPKLVDDWDCSFTDIIPVATKNLTFDNLLKKFFLFYAAFNYQSNVICPLLGKSVKKSSFAKSTELPEEMDIYKKRLNSKGEIEFFRFDSPMCIQDPVDQSQNMTKAVPKHLLRYFIEYCAVSAEYLKTHL